MKKNENIDPTTAQPVETPPVAEPVVEPVKQVAEVKHTTTPVTPNPSSAGTSKLAGIIAKIKGIGVVPIVAVVAVALVLIGGVILAASSSSPKAVFKNSINRVYKKANKAIDTYDKYLERFDPREKALLINADVKLDTNIEELKEYKINDFKFASTIGLDYDKEVITVNGKIEGLKDDITADVQLIDNKIYLATSLLEDVIVLEDELDIDFSEAKKEIEKVLDEVDTDPETYQYLLKTMKKALTKSLDSEAMEKEKDEVDVGDKELKVTKYSYIFDDKAIANMLEIIAEELLEDDEFIKKLAGVTAADKGDIKDFLKDMKKSAKDIEFDEEIILNVYTRGLFNSFAGVSIEVEDEEPFTYFTDGKNAEIVIEDGSEKIVVEITEDKKEYDVEVKVDKETILEAHVKEYNEEVIDLTFTIKAEGEEVKGAMYMTFKETKTKISGEYKYEIEYDGEKVAVEGTYGIEAKEELDTMNTKDAITADEVDPDELEKSLEKILEDNDELRDLIESSMEEAERENLSFNSLDMAIVNSYSNVSIEDVFAKKKATVLYVGDTYYYDSNASALLESLTDLQDELDFFSYYYSRSYVDESFRELVNGVSCPCSNTTQAPSGDVVQEPSQTPTETPSETPSTETTTPVCNEYPSIYLIKDGKVQKCFRGTVTKEELKTALTDLGI